jgi:hypothetical protein
VVALFTGAVVKQALQVGINTVLIIPVEIRD